MVPYEQLPEKIKDYDRRWAERIWNIVGDLVRKGDNPAEYFLPTDILPEPLGQDVMDALGGLDCCGCYVNEIEESHENLIAWKKSHGLSETPEKEESP